MKIEKKILPQYFEEVIKDNKTFELRKDEDDIQPGDMLILNEYFGKQYTGRAIERVVTYVLRNVPQYGLKEGYCIIGIKPLPKKIGKIERRPSEWGSPFICPECGSEQTPTEFFTIDGTEPKEKITWCYACGQKLDWGDQNG